QLSEAVANGQGEATGEMLANGTRPEVRDAKQKCERICEQRAGSVGGEGCLLSCCVPRTRYLADADCAGVYYDARHPALVALGATARITRTRRRCGRHLAKGKKPGRHGR